MITIDENPDIHLSEGEVTKLLVGSTRVFSTTSTQYTTYDNHAFKDTSFINKAVVAAIKTPKSTIAEVSNFDELVKILYPRSDHNVSWKLVYIDPQNPVAGEQVVYLLLEPIPEITNLQSNFKSLIERRDKLGERDNQDSTTSIQALEFAAVQSCLVTIRNIIKDARSMYQEQPGFPGMRLTKVAKVIHAWKYILRKCNVANPDAVNLLEHQAVLDAIKEEAESWTNDNKETGIWVHQVHDWLHESNNAALSNVSGHGPDLGSAELIPAMWELGLLNTRTLAYYAKLMLDVMDGFKKWGIQSPISMAALMHEKLHKAFPVDDIRAAITVLVSRESVCKLDGPELHEAAKRFPAAQAIADLANAPPGEVLYALS